MPRPSRPRPALRQRLTQHARTHWPDLTAVNARHRSVSAHIDRQLPDGTILPLPRRYNGSASI